MSGVDIHELLPLHALGVLEPDEADAVERAVAADPALAAELAELIDATHMLAGAVPAAVPPVEVKARLLGSVGGGRFESFSMRIAKMFDVTVDRARELLALTERDASWARPVPGVSIVHFAGGPACATADCGIVQIAPGGTFPWHRHRRDEMSVVLAGTIRDADGRLYTVGEEMFQPAGSEHDVATVGDEPAVFAACAFDGIELGQRP